MNHEPPDPEKKQPESVFLPVASELLKDIHQAKYDVSIERTGIELQPHKKKHLDGKMVLVTDENEKKLKEVRRWMRSMGGADKVPFGKKPRALSINDAADFVIAAFQIPMRKPDHE